MIERLEYLPAGLDIRAFPVDSSLAAQLFAELKQHFKYVVIEAGVAADSLAAGWLDRATKSTWPSNSDGPLRAGRDDVARRIVSAGGKMPPSCSKLPDGNCSGNPARTVWACKLAGQPVRSSGEHRPSLPLPTLAPAIVAASPKIVLVHDWLTGMRGGEKCLEVLCRQFPDAPLFTLLHRRGSTSPAIERMRIQTSFLQHFPGDYRYLLPLMPWAIESLQIPGDAQLVISFSHAVAKGIRVPPGVPHICFCFTPMRYAWHPRPGVFRFGSRPRMDKEFGFLGAGIRARSAPAMGSAEQ